MFYTEWLRYDLLADLWKIETRWRCNVLTLKLHINTEHLFSYNTIAYQIMQGLMMVMNPVKYGIVMKLNEHEILIPV